MTKYHFIIPLEPVEQARPRARRQGNGVRLYDPVKVKRYKQSLALLVKSQWKYPPLTGPLKVTVSFYRAIQARKKLVPARSVFGLSGATTQSSSSRPPMAAELTSTATGGTGVIITKSKLTT